MKPIEPGCLATIIGPIPENTGKVVRVLKCTGEVGTFSNSPIWYIDKKIHDWGRCITGGPIKILPRMVSLCSERYLMRIDGCEETEETTEEAEV